MNAVLAAAAGIVGAIVGFVVGKLLEAKNANERISSLRNEVTQKDGELAAARSTLESERAASERLNAEREQAWKDKLAAEQKSNEDKLAAERQSSADALASERKLCDEKIASEKRSQEEFRERCRQVLDERKQTIEKTLSDMMEKFKNSATETLAEREKELSASNKEQLKLTFGEMYKHLDELKKSADASQKTNGDLGVRIGEFFKNIRDTAASFGTQAKSFTDALHGANKKQGNWGEAVLAQLLVDCGLEEGKTFVTQTGSGGGIPDAQVFDYGSMRAIVIDSKMSWTKYEESYKLPDGPERDAALKEHVASVKKHVDELAAKDYPNTQTPLRVGFSFVPITVMFVPCTAALEAALKTEPGLMDYAFKRNVALATPLTLFGLMVLVSRAWSNYAADVNAKKIYDEATKLVKYVDRTFLELEALGCSLKKAQENYEAVRQLAVQEPSGQCLKGPALEIMRLGAKPEKGVKSKTLVAAMQSLPALA